MPRGLRLTHWENLDLQMTVMLEGDVKLPAEQAVQELAATANEGGCFLTWEIFEDDTDFAQAMIRATERFQERIVHERDMAMLFFYDAKMLPMTADDGLVVGTIPTPFDAEEIGFVFEQLCRHPLYKNQTLQTITADGLTVAYNKGVRLRER